MILLKNITLRNFLSTGMVTQAVSLDNTDLTLILGENLDLGGDGNRNGVGKSALIQAICYALFGVPINNIRKDNLVNRTNEKNMLVTLEFTVNGQSHKIERGRKPNVLRFYINDIQQKDDDVAQGENKSTQEAIERLINMKVDMFKHIVALNTYTEPFLALSSNDQRNIIEQLLGVTLLSEKAEVVKDLIRTSKDEIQSEEFKCKAIEEANKRVREQLESLKRRQRLWQSKHEEDLAKLVTEYEGLSEIDIVKELQAHQELAVYNAQSRLVSEYTHKITVLRKDISKEQQNFTKLENEIETLKDHKCYACGQEFHDEQHNIVLGNKNKQLSSSKTSIDDMCFQLDGLSANPVTLGTKPITHYETEAEAVKHGSRIEHLCIQLEQKTNETDPYSEQILEMESQAIQEINFDIINELTKTMDHQKFLLDLLTSKDSFVRKKIIDQNLSYLNNRLTHYLDKLGLPHQVLFKNDLTVEITELGRELDFGNLSRGEMNRVILGLSFAFRDVWENLYSTINVLFIDELLDNGTDSMGVENSLSILKDMCRRRKKAVWLVSHKEDLLSRVNNVLNVRKEGGFTSYSTADNNN